MSKQVYIDRNGEEVQHSIAQVKPFIEDLEEHNVETLQNVSKPLSTKDYSLINVNLTELLTPGDPRGNSEKFMEARKEMKGLLERGT